ncbi:MAG: hypothetical protein M1828_003399 [Chrysothrix sp. TS-e1954]|nr:MAG: hypothetical protein M1828_003399 [Chrysothrix sp. TS-e1954]
MSELLDFILSQEKAFQSKARLVSLYSDFALLRHTNPDGYAANIAAWSSAITNAAAHGLLPPDDSSLTLETGSSLAEMLEYKGLGRPAGLGAVFDDLVQRRQLVPLKEYLETKTSIYGQRSWLQLPTPWTVISWALRQAGLLGEGSTKLACGQYVRIAALETASSAILKQLSLSPQTPTSLTFSQATFASTFSSLLSTHDISQTDQTLLLTHLTRDRRRASMAIDPPTGSTTIRFLPSSASSETAPPPITQQDTTIASLSTLAHSLSSQTTALTARISDCQAKAHSAISTSNRTAALSALRARKAAEATLDQRQQRFEQITSILTSIDDAAGQVEMVAAMEAGTQVLKGLNRKVGGAERVEGVMDAMAEQMGEVEDVGGVIADGGGKVDEGEVDEEFEALEREEVQKRKKAQEEEEEERKESEKTHADFPPVPTGQPGEKQPNEETRGDGARMRENARPTRENTSDIDAVEKRLSTLSMDEGNHASSKSQNQSQSQSQMSTNENHAIRENKTAEQ